METPQYVARHSAWKGVTFLRVVLFWLIVPLIIMIVDIIRNKKHVIEFYDRYVIEKSGILNKRETKFIFAGVCSVVVNQTLLGRICNYGDVIVDVVGKRWGINTFGISRPQELKRFIEEKIINPDETVKVLSV